MILFEQINSLFIMTKALIISFR